MLTPYRRHLYDCPHVKKGQAFTLCSCPIWCYGRLTDGQTVRRSLRTSDWPRALQRIENMDRGGEDFFAVPNAVPTVSSAAAKFLESCRSRSLQQSTIKSYSKTLKYLAEAMGTRTVCTIDVPLLDSFAAARKVKPRTWAKELKTLRAFFAWCADRKWIAENFAKRLKAPAVDEPATLPFTDDEIRKLIRACDAIACDDRAVVAFIRHRARALVYTFLYSGLRVSDVAKLRRDALDNATGHLTLRMMKTRVPLKVLLHADVKRTLETLSSVNPEYFFWTTHGDISSCTRAISRTIERLGRIAGVRAHPHRFRDTFAVELLTNGADIRTVQLLLGHQSVKTTERHYAHFVPAHQDLLDRAAATLHFGDKAGAPVLVKTRQNRLRNA